jgi:serine/threonine-protein kinase
MGEVWRARDVRLGRMVAIKVLPAAFADDAERMLRFEREAHVLASLNHAHIAALYGFEESDGVRALVMELVEGPTLAERLANGAIVLEDALPLARQVAEALEYAHEHGIVHRDLKPANVKLTSEGSVKVLDFGLAKALADDPVAADVSHSPTLSGVATRAGIILGTAAYMSPEQAKGKPADRRSDVWSFGVVVAEMLTGKALFTGESAPETLARVIEREPDLGALPQATPARIRELLHRCLTKDPRRRLQAIGEARLALEEAIARPDRDGAPVSPGASPPPARRIRAWGFSAALCAGLGLLAGRWLWRQPTPPAAAALRLSIELGADLPLAATDMGPTAVLSPDGMLLAFVAQKAPTERARLYLRRLDQLQAAPLAGTEGARDPFFSPDGQWIAFFADRKLKKTSVTGGSLTTLCDAPNDRGGTWGDDGTLVFTPSTQPGTGLWRVSSAGGQPEILTAPDAAAEEVTHRWAQLLPGGRAVLFTANRTLGSYQGANIVVQALSGGARKVLLRNAYFARYLPSGHLVYIHERRLFAAPFDLATLEVTGPAAPVLEDVLSASTSGGAQFAFSNTGDLAYRAGSGIGFESAIEWIDPDGRRSLRPVVAQYGNIRFSPDGQKLAMDVIDGRQSDVWIYDWRRDAMSRLTFDPGEDAYPVWTPDGRRIVFASTRGGKAVPNLYWQKTDGTGDAQPLTASRNYQRPASWHPSGKVLAFHEFNPRTATDIMILPVEGDEASGWRPGEPSAFVASQAREHGAAFSPDGRWLAYSSNESGNDDVYVRPFPGPGGRWQVSTEGGVLPAWSPTRPELFFRTDRIMVAAYSVGGGSFRSDKPRLWSDLRVPGEWLMGNFDLHPDGRRVAAVRAPEAQADARPGTVVLIQGFFDELRRLAPTSPR